MVGSRHLAQGLAHSRLLIFIVCREDELRDENLQQSPAGCAVTGELPETEHSGKGAEAPPLLMGTCFLPEASQTRGELPFPPRPSGVPSQL